MHPEETTSSGKHLAYDHTHVAFDPRTDLTLLAAPSNSPRNYTTTDTSYHEEEPEAWFEAITEAANVSSLNLSLHSVTTPLLRFPVRCCRVSSSFLEIAFISAIEVLMIARNDAHVLPLTQSGCWSCYA